MERRQMHIYRKPQVLLIGNGLNRAYGGLNWSEGIQAINTNHRADVSDSSFDNVPYPLKAILATDDQIEDALTHPKADQLLFGIEDVSELTKPLLKLVDIGFDHILTTNYSYEIERSLDPGFTRKGAHKSLRIQEFNFTTTGKEERKYLLHTYNRVFCNGKYQMIWHIHGEGRKKKTVTLGHYYYGELLGQYQNVLLERQKNPTLFTDTSAKCARTWVDEFLDGDIYVLGFGFDYSEIDLWWLLCEKKKTGKGRVVFYEPNGKNNAKWCLLNGLNVVTTNVGYYHPTDYKEFYLDAIEDIAEKVAAENERVMSYV